MICPCGSTLGCIACQPLALLDAFINTYICSHNRVHRVYTACDCPEAGAEKYRLLAVEVRDAALRRDREAFAERHPKYTRPPT